MITVVASNGSRGAGTTVAAACRALVGGPGKLAVKVGRATFIPIEEATLGQLRHSGAVWINRDRGWRIAALVDEVVESQAASS